MSALFSQFFSAIGQIPMSVMPDGVAYWCNFLGISAVIGGIVTGVSTALTIMLAKYFLKHLASIIAFLP